MLPLGVPMNGGDANDAASVVDDIDQAEVGQVLDQQLGELHEGGRIVDRLGEQLARSRDEDEPGYRALRLASAQVPCVDEAGPLQRHRALARERRREGQVCLVEPSRPGKSQRDGAEHPRVEEQRDGQVSLARRCGWAAREAGPSFVDLAPGGGDHRPSRAHRLGHRARKVGGELAPMLDQLLGVAASRKDAQRLAGVDELGDHCPVRIECRHRPRDDRVTDGLPRDRPSQVGGDLLHSARALQRALGLRASRARARGPDPGEQLDLDQYDEEKQQQDDDSDGPREVGGDDAERADRQEARARDPRPARAGSGCPPVRLPPHRDTALVRGLGPPGPLSERPSDNRRAIGSPCRPPDRRHAPPALRGRMPCAPCPWPGQFFPRPGAGDCRSPYRPLP